MKFFNSPHPVAEMVLGGVFVAMALFLTPLVAAPADRVNHSPLNMIPAPVLMIVLIVAGVIVFIEGLGTYLKKR
jgi:hypothetical protein